MLSPRSVVGSTGSPFDVAAERATLACEDEADPDAMAPGREKLAVPCVWPFADEYTAVLLLLVSAM
jgi:hypothetical protein